MLGELSTLAITHGENYALSEGVPVWLAEVAQSYEGDTYATKVIEGKVILPTKIPDYTYIAGLLRYKGIIYIGENSRKRQRILKEMHDSAIGGHSGIVGTYQRSKRFFFWMGMKKDVHEYVKGCDICELSKGENVPYPGLLQPFALPEGVWVQISMDFSEGLPRRVKV